MPEALMLPLLSRMIPDGLVYGANYIVEFQPHSLWYETSLTLVAQAVKVGLPAEYHTYQHAPEEVRAVFKRLGVDVNVLEEKGTLLVEDSYTVATGIESPEERGTSKKNEKHKQFYMMENTLDFKALAEPVARAIREGAPESLQKHLHVDDNTSVVLQYNDERTVLDSLRTRGIPETRAMKQAVVQALVAGVYSEAFYRQYESLCDGIFDFESREVEGEIEHYMRVRLIRGQAYDSRWYRLKLLASGEVSAEPVKAEARELGIGGWIKGAKGRR